MEKTALFGLPFPGEKDKPDGPTQITEAVKSVENLLAILEFLLGTPKAPAAPAPGQLVVVSGTSDPVYKTVTGDVAINSGGVTTIGEGKVTTAKIAELAVTANRIADKAVLTAKLADLGVTTEKLAALAVATAKIADQAVTAQKIADGTIISAKFAASAVVEAVIADGAVTSRKFKPTVGTVVATGDLMLPEAYADVPGAKLEITPAVASTLKLHVVAWGKAVAGNQLAEVAVKVDGGAEHARTSLLQIQAGEAKDGFGSWGTASQIYALPLTAVAHTIKLRAKRISAAGEVHAAGTAFLYELVAS